MEPRKWKNANFRQALFHSLEGISYTFRKERNLKIQIVFMLIALIFGVVLKLSFIEFAILSITISLVIFAELINTAIEVMMDLYSEDYNEKIKVVKDISSGAVLIVSIQAIVSGGLMFLPKILELWW